MERLMSIKSLAVLGGYSLALVALLGCSGASPDPGLLSALQNTEIDGATADAGIVGTDAADEAPPGANLPDADNPDAGGGYVGPLDAQGVDSPTGIDASEVDASEVDASEVDATAVDSGAAPSDAALVDAAAEAGVALTDAGAPPTTVTVDVAFFGWTDNEPAGNEIAFPRSGGYPTKHDVASGTGTYADPITFGGDPKVFPPGTVLYVPYIEKYVILEDECTSCEAQAAMTNRPQIAIWMASDASTPAMPLAKCEDSWTRTTVMVVENPAGESAVTTPPLFDPATVKCRTTP
jgi:hypothetical protein